LRLVNRHLLIEFINKHSDCRSSIASLINEFENSNWASSQDIKLTYPKASIIGGKCVVFNIKGNKYRLVAKINYSLNKKAGVIKIMWAGTHKEYDKLDLRRTLCLEKKL